jgi:hypothetical protein
MIVLVFDNRKSFVDEAGKWLIRVRPNEAFETRFVQGPLTVGTCVPQDYIPAFKHQLAGDPPAGGDGVRGNTSSTMTRAPLWSAAAHADGSSVLTFSK